MKRQPGAMHFLRGLLSNSQSGWNRGSLCTRPRTLCPGMGAYFNWRDFNVMEKVVNLAKQRGFVFPGSEIYGGLSKHMGLRSTWN